MADFRLGRLKFNWRGDWVASTAYVIDDIVKFGANTYVCTTNHTSAANETTWYTTDASNWQLHTEGIRNVGTYVNGTFYKINDVLKYGNTQYRVTAGIGTTDPLLFAAATYTPQSVDYNPVTGVMTIVINGHGLSNGEEIKIADLSITLTCNEDSHQTNHRYPRVSDPISKQWLPISNVTQNSFDVQVLQTAPSTNTTQHLFVSATEGCISRKVNTFNVTSYTSGFNGEGAWNAGIIYEVGDVVSYAGNSSVAITTTTQGVIPPTELLNEWNFLSEGVDAVGLSTYEAGVTYYKGQLVQTGGNVYRHNATSSVNVHPTKGLTTGIGSTMVGVAATAWILFNQGLRYDGSYSTDKEYYPNDVVEYSSSSYVGIGSTAWKGVTPGTNADLWSALSLGDSNAVLTQPGDVLIRDNTSPVRLGAGQTGQTLGISTLGIPAWQTSGNSTRIYYVDPEKGSDTYNGSSPDMSFRTLKYACDNASAITNITGFVYDHVTGLSTVTAPSHGILYPNVTVRLNRVKFGCYSGGRTYLVNAFQYDGQSGIGTVTVGAAMTGIAGGQSVRLDNLKLTCPGYSGFTTDIYPDGTRANGNNFVVGTVLTPQSFNFNVGVSTFQHVYVSGGTVFVGLTSSYFPSTVLGSYFNINEVVDNNTFTVNVGVSTISHTYEAEGTVINLSPAVVRCSASEFVEQTPIVVPPFTSVVGSTLRSSMIRPAAGLNADGLDNNRATLFQLSDSTTIQGLNFKGMVGFNYDADNPTQLEYSSVRTGVGSTACGNYFAFNPVSPILNKSPYVKDCTAFGEPPTGSDARVTGEGAGVGCLIDGGVHATGFRTMVFDAFTNVLSDGAGFILDKGAGAEIVSSFTYYAKWGYYSGGGSRIRAVGGNNSYGDYGVISSGFNTDETPRTARLFGDRMDITTGSITNTCAVGNTMIGETSGAYATYINDQTAADRVYFKYYPGYGDPGIGGGGTGIGTTSFVKGEQITFIGAGTTGALQVKNVTGSVSGQKGVIMELDLADPNNLPLVGDAVGFTTTAAGIGSDRIDGQPRYYIVNAVTGFQTNFTQNRGSSGNTAPVTYTGRLTITISPEKGVGTWDTRLSGISTTGADVAHGGSFLEFRSKFSNARLTGHDFLSVGVGNKVETNYPDVNEANVVQGNETNTFGPGKVFYVSTDQGGNFRVGDLFAVNQLTGAATLDASAFNLSGLTELRLGSLGGQIGEAISEFSSDETMSGNSNNACPTEFALVGYITRGNMGTDQMVPPKGTTAQRPAIPILGGLRYNTTIAAFESYNGSAWVPLGGLQNVDVTSTYTASSFQTVWCNTSGGGFTVTLPAAPNKGDTIRFFDVAKTFDSNNLTIGRNGKPIMGDSSDMTVNTEGAAFDLVFYDNSSGWRVFTV